MQLNYTQNVSGRYILSKNDIENIATAILKEYSPQNLTSPVPLDTSDLLENYLGLTIKRKYIGTVKSGILGLIVMNDVAQIPSYDDEFRPTVLEETFGTVLISQHLMYREEVPRKRFTEAHEGAHFILHREYFSRCSKTSANERASTHDYIACREKEMYNITPKKDVEWIEWQANSLAAALLMPKDIFCEYSYSIIRRKAFLDGYLDIQPSYCQVDINNVINNVAKKFNVSYKAAKIRMMQVGLAKE